MNSLPLSADVPLTDPSTEDELGRSAFSERIAQLVVDSVGVSPPVVGIVGEWGSGKTTVLNFVEWHLLKVRPGTATLRFNAWRHASGGRGAIQTALVEQVAARILGRLGRAQEKVKKALRTYGSGALQAGELARTPIPGVKTASSIGASALAKIPDSRNRVVDALTDARQPVVVFIDDVDRLLGQELLELFAAMRVVVDLPYVQYVLAYDEDAVSGALDRLLAGGDGQAFIEKVVALPVAIPRPSFAVLYRRLTHQLEGVLKHAGMDIEPLREMAFDLELKEVFRSTLAKPRDIVRYMNRIQALVPLALAAELHPQDFVVNEWIAVFVPELSAALGRNLSTALLEEVPFESFGSNDKQAKPIARATDTFGPIVQAADAPLARSIDHALGEALPALREALRNGRTTNSSVEPQRMAHPNYFSRYFSYTAWADDAPDQVVADCWSRVVEGADFEEVFIELLRVAEGRAFVDKLVKAIDANPADTTIVRRVLTGMERIVLTPEWRQELVAARPFGDQRAMVHLDLAAAHMIRCAHGLDNLDAVLEAVASLRSSRFLYDITMRSVARRSGSDAEVEAFINAAGDLVRERLQEPDDFRWYGEEPELLVDPSRYAVRDKISSVANAWTPLVMIDQALVRAALAPTQDVRYSSAAERFDHLSWFVDRDVARTALINLPLLSNFEAGWLKALETNPSTDRG